MAFCITFGTHEFTDQLKGYEGVTAQCHNCGNWSAHCITRWPFFTICFLPLIPLAMHRYQEVACPICHFTQDLSYRPDVQSQGQNGGGPMPSHGGPPPPGMQGGLPAPGGPGGGPPPPGMGGPPAYK